MPTLKLDVIPLVLDFHQSGKQSLSAKLFPDAKTNDHVLKIPFFPDTIDTGNAGNHDYVLPGQKRTHGRQPQPLNLIVNARILLDERVRLWDVRLRLVVVEVTDKIFHRVFREEPLELGIQLRCQRLVMGNDESRLGQVLNHIGHRERFPRTGHTKQRLVFRTSPKPLG